MKGEKNLVSWLGLQPIVYISFFFYCIDSLSYCIDSFYIVLIRSYIVLVIYVVVIVDSQASGPLNLTKF